MKIYAFTTPSHRILVENYFFPSISSQFDVVLKDCPQRCASAEFMQDGWLETMKFKIALIIEAVEQNWGGVFIHSDVDVQFFGLEPAHVLKIIKNYDLMPIYDNPSGILGMGFLVCRGNQKNLKLWRDIYAKLNEPQAKDNDQRLFNYALRNASGRLFRYLHMLSLVEKLPLSSSMWHINKIYKSLPNQYDIHWNYLPRSFFSPGTSCLKLWTPGEELQLPRNILIHHANYTKGISDKIKQLEYVRSVVNKKSTAKVEMCQ